jgi:sodium-dependent dicarboxylate transporter 2/3/5
METHGVDRRLAYSLLAHPWIGGSVARMLWGLGLASAFLSMWISNTACVAMLFPVVLAIAKTTEEQLGAPAPRITTSLLLMLAYAASIGGMATPVGTPPNLIGIALVEKGAGMHIGFLTWMAIGVPITLVLFVALFAILRLFHAPEARIVPGQLEAMQQAASMLGAWSAGQRNAIAAFAVAIVLWIGPGVIAGTLGSEHAVSQALADRLPEGVAALFAASLLFVLPVDWKRRTFTLAWADAVRIDWGTILLFGGGIALGKLSFDTGLAEAIGRGLVAAFGISTPEALSGAAAGTATLVSETSSNTASANMVVPVMMSMAQAIGAPAAIAGVAATLGASLGFMLPISTPPNAIVYGSGRIRIGDMVKTGLVLDLVGVAVVWIAMVILAPRVLG